MQRIRSVFLLISFQFKKNMMPFTYAKYAGSNTPYANGNKAVIRSIVEIMVVALYLAIEKRTTVNYVKADFLKTICTEHINMDAPTKVGSLLKS